MADLTVQNAPAELSAKYTDALGRTWTAAITIAEVKRLRREANFVVDTLIPADEKADLKPLANFLADDERFSEVLFTILTPACKQAGVDQDSFDRGLAGDCIDDAKLAFLAALHDFFPAAKKKIIAAVIRMTGKAKTKAAAKLTAAMAAIPEDELVDAVLANDQAKIAQILGKTGPPSNSSPTSGPASSASTPPPSP